ncbi:hypothetical protein EVAR_20422_1 [Eumeta japonica]|uniref:Uncharacterized protein n=1 Tax=Eumeta variegata TaxID=151549 RepID=A0A4C1TY15_EUMVA|nr:hypothetical protein EVAR_20422_1 [Eumeta japonica]
MPAVLIFWTENESLHLSCRPISLFAYDHNHNLDLDVNSGSTAGSGSSPVLCSNTGPDAGLGPLLGIDYKQYPAIPEQRELREGIDNTEPLSRATWAGKLLHSNEGKGSGRRLLDENAAPRSCGDPRTRNAPAVLSVASGFITPPLRRTVPQCFCASLRDSDLKPFALVQARWMGANDRPH